MSFEEHRTNAIEGIVWSDYRNYALVTYDVDNDNDFTFTACKDFGTGNTAPLHHFSYHDKAQVSMKH